MQVELYEGRVARSQYFTPEWLAWAIVERYFPGLGAGDLVVEPSCGPGAFLKAIPAACRAIGVELDPELADCARRATGREVITGDFRLVALPDGVTAVVGNPPFKVRVIDQFLARAHRLLPEGGRCGFLLPAYAFRQARRVSRYGELWSVSVEMIPAWAFYERMNLPMVFTLFTKDRRRLMVGLAFYKEASEVDNLAGFARRIAREGAPGRGVWRALVEAALARLGGEASLADLYRVIEPHRPTPNPWWQEKVRQVCQLHCARTARGVWSLRV